MTEVEKRRVLRRKVFFIHGFDPRDGQRYKDRYSAEAKDQSPYVDYRLAITDLPGDQADSTWKTAWQKDGWPVTVTEFEALEWGDLVRAKMRVGVMATLASALRSFWILWRAGVFGALMRLDHFKTIAFLIPYLVICVQILLAAGIAGAGWTLVSGLGAPWMAWGAALALFGASFWMVRRTKGFFMTSYSLNLYEFCVGERGAYTPQTESRIAAFEEKVIAAMGRDYDEVVVIGHSFGANLALSTVSDVVRSGTLPRQGPQLTLVTIGAFLINMTVLPDAWRQRRDMRFLAGQERVAWYDLSAQADRYIFSLYDPVKASGVAPDPQLWPKMIPVRYRHNLRLKTYKTLRRSFFDTHLQYIQAFDRPRDYDYFALTAGPTFVRDYFAGRKSEARGRGQAIGRYHSTAPDAHGAGRAVDNKSYPSYTPPNPG
ncbi:MAG: hypothetical protein AAFY25_13875 [Pseudomonadota bacterium]